MSRLSTQPRCPAPNHCATRNHARRFNEEPRLVSAAASSRIADLASCAPCFAAVIGHYPARRYNNRNSPKRANREQNEIRRRRLRARCPARCGSSQLGAKRCNETDIEQLAMDLHAAIARSSLTPSRKSNCAMTSANCAKRNRSTGRWKACGPREAFAQRSTAGRFSPQTSSASSRTSRRLRKRARIGRMASAISDEPSVSVGGGQCVLTNC